MLFSPEPLHMEGGGRRNLGEGSFVFFLRIKSDWRSTNPHPLPFLAALLPKTPGQNFDTAILLKID